MSADTLRIYVASLSDYNAGILHGRWIDADQDVDTIHEEIANMLKESPAAQNGDVAEEYAIHDYDGFGGFNLGEFESLEKITAIAKALDEYPSVVVAHYFTENSHLEPDEILPKIQEGLVTTITECWGDETKALAEYLYDDIESELPERFKSHTQAVAESMAHDYLQGGDYYVIYEGGGTYHILDSHA
ncbi:antirestriction protein ArdA [Streptomyces sp. CB03238]|uniref:antirestriction protein ArdA n=1 Tax=Streptomyces sp. CB03238 TaxID=1907777 RepID=UPI0015C4B672|nr:antirestriction protein ArdA [Streptomyces sp. CB03238]